MWTAWRHLRGFFAWLHEEGDIETNPMANLRKPVVPPSEIKVLSTDDVRRLLATCAGRTSVDRRDRALLTLMLDTGLRLSEVARLRTDDIGDDNYVRVYGKGRKWRTVALGITAATALRRWMRLLPTGSEHLWMGSKGPLTPTGIRKAIERRGRATGIDLHPHQLRHTFVDNWLRNGGSEVDLARLCGWTSTRMAERYALFHFNLPARLERRNSVRPLRDTWPADTVLIAEEAWLTYGIVKVFGVEPSNPDAEFPGVVVWR